MKKTAVNFLLSWVPEGLLTRHLTRRLKDQKRPVSSQLPRQRASLSRGEIAATVESQPCTDGELEAKKEQMRKAAAMVDEAVALLTAAKRNVEACLNSRDQSEFFDADADAKIELMNELNQSILQG
jgi:hypothetical protein